MRKIKQVSVTVILFVCFCFCETILFAHPGGHYQTGDVLNTWTLANGHIIRGNFTMGKGDNILLEQLGGKLITIPIRSLSMQDQKLARYKIKKIEQLNVVVPDSAIKPESSITKWSPFFLVLTIVLAFVFVLSINTEFVPFIKYNQLLYSPGRMAFSLMAGLLFIFACKKTTTTVTSAATSITTTILKTTTSFIDSAYTPYKNTVTTSWDATYFYIASNGIPTHNMMVGITNWQHQVPIPQFYTGTNKWSIPLQPEYAITPLSTKSNLMKGAVAIAVNGVPIFNALNNRGEDSYLIGELDQWGGHCGKGDDYHYHAAPLHLSATSGLKPIAFALDGFAVYGATEADGSTMAALDTCHGHTIGNGTYHYHGTTNYPYVVGAMKGKVTIDPTTPAPESQIIPQAFSSPLRPATNPLSGASITAFISPAANAYSLTYKRGTKNGYINYSWDANNKYTFIFTDTAGMTTTATYQR